jgi:hypothetical protein
LQLRWQQQELGAEEPHDGFIMTGAQADYARFASDLSGFDIRSHGETTNGVVELLVEWLQGKRGAASHASTPAIVTALPRFCEAKQEARRNFGNVWSRYVAVAVEVAERFLPSA